MKAIKIFLLECLAVFFLWPVFLVAAPPDTLGVKAPVEKSDTVEYELLIIDPAFEQWFQRHQRPESYYSLSYLENWNRLLVTQWNLLISRPGRPDCMPMNYLYYDPAISYGIALNHKLFYYFKYMHQRCRVFDNNPAGW